jgi:hypothetical protein
MEIGSEFFSTTRVIDLPVAPRPRLLLELEPAHRVFLGNLLDLILFRSPPPISLSSRPGRFWNDVLVPTSMPWWAFGESMLWHMLFVAALWSLSQGIALRDPALLRPNPRRSYISYYRPSPTFPVAGSRPARPQQNARTNAKAARQSPIQVSREGKPGLVLPPDLKLGQPGQPDVAGSGPAALPAMPFSATRRSKLSVPEGSGSAVAPPPEVRAAAGRRGGLPQVSVVAPPPDVAALSSRRGLGAPATSVVEPPPSVKGALRKLGDVNIGHADVVAPAPRLPMHEQRAGLGMDQAGLGGSSSSVVPPPPSIDRSGTLNGGRVGSMAGTRTQIVPPPPAIQEASNVNGAARAGSLSAGGLQIVPPPPSMDGLGNASGRGRGNGISDNGVGVVPPAPSARNLRGSGRAGRGSSLSGAGLQVVPPPPSMQGVGGSGGSGKGSALAGGGMDAVAPAPSGRVIGGSTGSGRGGALGGTGLQASGPTSGSGSAGRADGNANGSSTGTGKGSLTASAGSTGAGSGNAGGAGAAGGGNGGGPASSRGNGGGSAAGDGNGGSGKEANAGAGNGGLAAGGTGSGGSGAPGGSGGNGTSGSSAGSPAGSASGTNPDGVNIGAGGRPFAADIPRPRPPILDNPPGPQDLPLRVIGLAMALPSSSYFSNYEVFIAERRVSKDETQLIKLVYVSLPYQRRLSEYGLNNRVFKLRVTRDPTCDETLMQMTWPEGDQPKPGAPASPDAAELNSDRDKKLPCYRTTADDYRKAVSRSR